MLIPDLDLLLCVMLLGWVIYQQIFSKKKAGRILMNVRPVNGRWFILAFGYFNMLSALYYLDNMIIAGFESWNRSGDSAGVLSYTWLSISLLSLGYSQLCVHENGIMFYGNLVKWERIESFAWEPENKKTWFLTLRYPGRLPTFLRETILYIPTAQKDEFAALLDLGFKW